MTTALSSGLPKAPTATSTPPPNRQTAGQYVVLQINPVTDAFSYEYETGNDWTYFGQITANANRGLLPFGGLGSTSSPTQSDPTVSTLASSILTSPTTTTAITAAGNYLYAVTDSGSAIDSIDTTTGAMSAVAGYPGVNGFADGTGTDAFFASPQALVSDGQGDIYVADTGNNVVVCYKTSGTHPIRSAGRSTPARSTRPGAGRTPPSQASVRRARGKPDKPSHRGLHTDLQRRQRRHRRPGAPIHAHLLLNLAQYQASNELTGPMETGWVDDCSTNLIVDPATGDVTMTEDDGSQVVFVPPDQYEDCPGDYVTPALGGGYCALPRVAASLTSTGAGYELSLPDGTSYLYYASGRVRHRRPVQQLRYGHLWDIWFLGCPTTPVSYETLTYRPWSVPRHRLVGHGRVGDDRLCHRPDEPPVVLRIRRRRQPRLGHRPDGPCHDLWLRRVQPDTRVRPRPHLDHTPQRATRWARRRGAHRHLLRLIWPGGQLHRPGRQRDDLRLFGHGTSTGSGDVVATDPDGTKTQYNYENGELITETAGYEQSSPSRGGQVQRHDDAPDGERRRRRERHRRHI